MFAKGFLTPYLLAIGSSGRIYCVCHLASCCILSVLLPIAATPPAVPLRRKTCKNICYQPAPYDFANKGSWSPTYPQTSTRRISSTLQMRLHQIGINRRPGIGLPWIVVWIGSRNQSSLSNSSRYLSVALRRPALSCSASPVGDLAVN